MSPFSVLTEPVIPVLMPDGGLKELGIRDVFIHAHEIKDLQCSSPLEKYALARLLIAFAMDMLHPETWMDRQELFETGRFDSMLLNAYIVECEKKGSVFDLFDPTFPFMQTAYDPEADETALKPAAALSVSIPSGNNHIFLDHRMEADSVMTPAEAFRAMTALYVFCTAAAQGYPSGVNNTPPIYSLVIGNNLFETIILNMVSIRECSPLDYGIGKVPWRTGSPVIPKKLFADISLLEGLTWQPRRICLRRDEDGYVRSVALQQGSNFLGNDLWRDPHVAYRCTNKGLWVSVKPQQGRALWRDVGTLLADTSNAHYHPPLTVSRATDILDNGTVLLQIQQVGEITSNASYIGWLEDRLAIPPHFLENDLLASLIRDDTEIAETTQSSIAKAVNRRFNSDTSHSGYLAEEARLRFLSDAHSILFGFCIPDLVEKENSLSNEAIHSHIQQYHSCLEAAIQNTFREVVQNAGISAKDLQLQIEARREVMNYYRKNTKAREERYE